MQKQRPENSKNGAPTQQNFIDLLNVANKFATKSRLIVRKPTNQNKNIYTQSNEYIAVRIEKPIRWWVQVFYNRQNITVKRRGKYYFAWELLVQEEEKFNAKIVTEIKAVTRDAKHRHVFHIEEDDYYVYVYSVVYTRPPRKNHRKNQSR